MFDFISPIIAGILLLIGVFGLIFRNKIAIAIAKINPFFPAQTTLLIISIIALFASGIAGIGAMWSAVTGSFASVEKVPVAVEGVSAYGTLSVILHDGVSNSTTTEDYLNDEQDFMTIYSADASIADGEEYSFNATIERSAISEDANIKVVCSIPDKEISGVTADNLAEKTSGRIDLDYTGGSTTGYFLNDNSVRTYVAFAEGTGAKELTIKFDHEETYHDGMTDMDDYVDVTCKFGDAGEVTTILRIYANS